MSVTHNTPVRVVIGDTVVGAAGQLGTNAQIIIYSGTPPASAKDALASNVAIATITGVNFGADAGGVNTITSSVADSNAVGGTAAFWRALKSDGTTVVLQGLCGTSNSDMNLDSLSIAAGANVSITTGTYTACP